jgi:hypothetical protein
LFYLCIAAIVALVIGWVFVFFILRDKEGLLRGLLTEGNLLRLLTVVFIVLCTTLLAILGKLNEAVSAIFGGIAGYVLGSIRQKKHDNNNV